MTNNPLFAALGGMPSGNNNPLGMLQQLRSNPMAFLQKSGFNVPPNIISPQGIVQHLMNSGQITQEQYAKARQMAAQFGVNV